jgi:hypothetical protein
MKTRGALRFATPGCFALLISGSHNISEIWAPKGQVEETRSPKTLFPTGTIQINPHAKTAKVAKE